MITSDLLLDVVRAAEPRRRAEAIAKLEAARVDGGDFAAMIDKKAPFVPPRSIPVGDRPSAPIKPQVIGGHVAPRPREAALLKLEQYLLSSFIEQMLPKATADTFGSGTAGNVWRSMLAEQLGTQIASAGGIGLASRLATDRRLS